MNQIRNRGAAAALAALLIAIIAGVGRASVAELSLAGLDRQTASDSFTFIVWGDNRCRAGALNSPTFARIIRDSNLLAPAFTVGVGDLISNAEETDLEWTREQWADFIAAVGRFDMPCMPVIGNHDLDGPQTSGMYEELVGPRRYSFDFAGCRFIVLDSEQEGGFGAEQFQWLSDRLAQGERPRHVFLFMHAPMFRAEAAWEPIHLLLRRFPVRAVFAGHEHIYCYDERDGIRYVITGGAGAPLRDPPERGGFYHYVIANVRGDEISLAVVREGAMLPPECVLRGEFDLTNEMLAAIAAPEIDAPVGECAVVAGEAELRNPGDEVWDGVARWRASGGWLIEPEQVGFSLAPGENARIAFTVHVPGPLPARYPLPELTVDYATDAGRTLSFAKPVRLRSLLSCPRADGFDGVKTPVPVTPPDFFRPVPDDLSASVQLRWDAQALHVLVAVVDDIRRHEHYGDDLWEGDSIQVFFDMAADGNARDRQADDHEFCAGRGARGAEVWRYAGPGAGAAAENVTCEISEDATGRTYALVIPWAELKPFEPKPGATFGFSLVVNDDDGFDAGGLMWLELTPRAGSGRTPFPLDAVILE
ncbi:MAG: metallophosphoesterase [Armatimonadota bacterium]|nr:MAG: metallophosphoesterase [Armatimonadota bacterium]